MAPRESRAAPEWDAAQVRELFFSYSRGRGYKFLPSGPVLPVGDSKGPFHGALDHFNQAFLGPAPWSHGHAGSAFSLHCINMSDMLVDFSDPSHHSLMDIFCNWFVGSTSNSDAIHCVLNFLTGTCKFSAGRIYVTCYADDDESREICMKFLSKKQLLNFTCETNYYIGKNGCGPCGPCTKIFYLPSDNRKYHGHSAITIDGETYIELANIVSVEVDKEDDMFWPLVIKHAVSGINYECLVTLLQHKESFYDTDLFTKMFEAIRKYACNKVQPYSGNASVTCDVDAAYRLFADHVRIISCASAPQSQLGERGREYFLNFIDRRAIESGHQKLKIEAHFYPELLKVAVIMMDPIYPDLNIKDRIEEILKTEMLIYKKALDELDGPLASFLRDLITFHLDISLSITLFLCRTD
ncbi:hypothetical protein SORBI_3003G369066 [Sorghum bicolor]|uniref:alanine--tRNA ligase n=1 Tax=Sorghum bicolor TaxID=4558 RepID=A0A1W0W0Q8_SORBI|nr:hypothetical protein SORBI_3003G369066 [Sorghum bicolor]